MAPRDSLDAAKLCQILITNLLVLKGGHSHFKWGSSDLPFGNAETKRAQGETKKQKKTRTV